MVEQSQLFHLVAFADILAQALVATAPFPVPPLGAIAFALAYEIRTGVNVISAPSDVDPPSTKVWLTGGRPGGAISTQSKLLGFLSNAEGGGVRAGWKPAVRQTPTAPLCCELCLVALACVLDDPLSQARASHAVSEPDVQSRLARVLTCQRFPCMQGARVASAIWFEVRPHESVALFGEHAQRPSF